MGDGGGAVAGSVLLVQHADSEGPGLLQPVLEACGRPLRCVLAHRGDGIPKSAAEASAIVVLGGPMGVYEADRHRHLKDEIRLAEDALRRGVPILGICLGSQILAAAAGARVGRGPAQEIGWFEVTLTPEGLDDPVLGSLPPRGTMFHWHGDTFDPPAGGTLLASSRLYAQQAFRVGPSAWGVQFHPEITEEMVDDWSARALPHEAEAFGGTEGAERMRAAARRHVPPLRERVQALGRAFLALSAP